ncbi:ubiquitin family domain-containing protein [Cyclospora cayetanensis]|uniref:Ubiquitin family domain-containing protein n=1 Tax=Cyclospora cayetanensis TaxID=88456 RepID=A0A1D3DAS0_9EIME|nr:ubiquitin family domain-containing protein [Cyclospora cayetanensis]
MRRGVQALQDGLMGLLRSENRIIGTVDGRNFSLQLPEDLEISALLELAAEALQQQPVVTPGADSPGAATTSASIRLIFRGQALQPEQQLQHYRIQSGQTIHVVQRLEGADGDPPSPRQLVGGFQRIQVQSHGSLPSSPTLAMR